MPYEKARAQMDRSPSRPSLFRVSIPRQINNAQFDANDYLKFFCKSASIPSISHETIAANGHERMGVVRQQPVGINYQKPFTITVIERTDFIVYNAMKQWFDRTSPLTNNPFIALSQRMGYYNDHICDIKLKKLEYSTDASNYNESVGNIVTGKTTPDGFISPLVVTFRNAYITNIGDIALSSDARDAFLEFPVSFNYETYITESQDTDNDD